MYARIESTVHAVIPLPSLTGRGKRPVRTPAHHVDFPTGITVNTWGSRTKPVSGS